MFSLSAVTDRVSDLTGYSKLENEDTEDAVIEFVTKDEYYGAIPEPIPANRVIPDWYRNLPGRVGGNEDSLQSTVKRCAPFMEAMTMGWIIPLAGEVEFMAQSGRVEWKSDFKEELIDAHGMAQVGGEAFPNSDWPVLKFINPWCIKVPDGYSALITSPFNRIEPLFQTFSGVVDVDSYFNNINAPFMWTGGDFEGVVEDGRPIVQVIPFKRGSMITDGITRPMTEDESMEKEKTRTELTSHKSMYRDRRWVHKKGSRNLPFDPDSEDGESGSSCPFHRS
jgi:hypothetical protein